ALHCPHHWQVFYVPCLLLLYLSLHISACSITPHLYSRLRSSHVSSFALTGGGIDPHTPFRRLRPGNVAHSVN
ncbi:hypothetical protein BJV77DRAFT_1183293, partial [Russula vinacea]